MLEALALLALDSRRKERESIDRRLLEEGLCEGGAGEEKNHFLARAALLDSWLASQKSWSVVFVFNHQVQHSLEGVYTKHELSFTTNLT